MYPASADFISNRIIMKRGDVLNNPQHPYSIALKNAVLTPDFA